MALGIGYGLPFVAQHGNTNPYKVQWVAARDGAKGAGATVEDENAGVGSCLVSRGQDVYTDGLPFTPSLLIVPQFYKAGNLYQDVPPFVAEDSTMRFTVSRNTTATRVNSSGLIESVASGVPRIDWLGQSCPALLVEASGQNLVLRSEDFTTTWLPTNITVTTGSTTAFTAPDGTTNADLLTSTASGSARIIQSFSFVSGTTYTYSAFAKAGSGFFGLTMENGGVASGVAVIWNLNTGALAVSGVVGSGYTLQSQGIENYGNGWYRCRMTVVMSVSVAGNIRANTSNGTMSTTVIQSDNGNSVYVWGAQLETGSVATTYIPTTSGAVSRAADVISASGALVSSLIGQTEGTIYVEGSITNYADAAASFITISDNTITNRVEIRKGSSNRIIIERNSATQSGTTSITLSGQGTGIFKMAVAYFSGNTAFFVNGVQVGSNNTDTFTMATLTHIYLGINAAGSARWLNDRIRSAALYTTRLSNAQLAELTRL